MHTSRAFGVLVAIALSIVGIAAQRSSDPIAIDADDIWPGSSAGRRDQKRAPGSSRKRRTFRRASHGSSSRTIAAVICCPTCPRRTIRVWVRGYGLVDSPKVQATPGKLVNLTAVAAPGPARGRSILSGRVLVLAGQACQTRASFQARGRRATGSRPTSRLKPNGCATSNRAAASPVMRSARGPLASSRRSSATSNRRWPPGPQNSIGPGRDRHDADAQSARPKACARDVRGLDRSRRGGRAAANAAAAARDRAQRRDHRVGLGRSEGVPARRSLDRSAQSRRSTPTA